ncbi:MAG: hypothetical protein ABIQ73_02790 [Acidimicrobiales bacterium]
MTDSHRRNEADKLWTAVKRDYFVAVETVAGTRPPAEGDVRWTRLLKNWRALCSMDIDLARQLNHGLREVSLVFDADQRGPADGHLMQQLNQIPETPDSGSAASDPEFETAAKLHDLAEGALQRRIDEDPAHL